MSGPGDTEGGGFLSRWSRLKQETRQPQDIPPAPADAERPRSDPGDNTVEAGSGAVSPAALRQAQGAGSAVEPAPELPLPSLDDITPGADVAAFFQKHVPEALRTAALRKLWVTDPEIKGFIEMADYQWDFTNPDSIPGWSSKLEGVDIEAMVGRLFPDAGRQDRDPPQPQGENAPAAAAPDTALPPSSDAETCTETSTESATSDQPADAPEGPGPAHVAVQKNPSESSVYEPVQRRHGRALPT